MPEVKPSDNKVRIYFYLKRILKKLIAYFELNLIEYFYSAEVNSNDRSNGLERFVEATTFGIDSIACEKQQFTLLDSRNYLLWNSIEK